MYFVYRMVRLKYYRRLFYEEEYLVFCKSVKLAHSPVK